MGGSANMSTSQSVYGKIARRWAAVRCWPCLCFALAG
jgi:hypothetical protein